MTFDNVNYYTTKKISVNLIKYLSMLPEDDDSAGLFLFETFFTDFTHKVS
jgi:hypothetical protein